MSKPTVYVVQKPVANIDVTPATRHGQLRVLLAAGDVVMGQDEVVKQLRLGLASFSDRDHLLLTGDPVAVGMAVTVAQQVNKGRVKVLRWMKREKDYLSLSLEF